MEPNPERNLREGRGNFPRKLNSIQLDQLYNKLQKENKPPSSANPVVPNIITPRKRKTASPTLPGTSEQHDDSQSTQDGWKISKNTRKRRPMNPDNCDTDSVCSENKFQALSDVSDMECNEEEQIPDARKTQDKRPKRPPPIHTLRTIMNSIINTILSLNVPKTAFAIKESGLSDGSTNHTRYLQRRLKIIERLLNPSMHKRCNTTHIHAKRGETEIPSN